MPEGMLSNIMVTESISKSVELTGKWINLLDGSGSNFLEKRIQYQNTKGEKFETLLKILLHT